MSTRNGLTRRRLLKTGGICLALPALESWTPRKVTAAESKQKLIVVYQPDGTIDEGRYGGRTWFPTGNETNFDLPVLSAPLDPVKQHAVFLKGFGNYAPSDTAAHGDMMQHCLRGKRRGGGPTIDQIVAEHWRDSGEPFRSLEFGIANQQAAVQHSRLSYNAQGDAITPESNPLKMYDRLFGSNASGDASNDAALNLLRRKQSVLDSVFESFKHIQAKVSNSDQSRLDEHADAVRGLENTLGTLANDAEQMARDCNGVDREGWRLDSQTQWYGGDKISIPNIERVTEAQQSMLSMAVRCGLTRVATLFHLRSNSGQQFPHLGVNSGQHGLAHNWHADFRGPAGKQQYTETHKWRARLLLDLVRSFESALDQDGQPMLENTLILHTSEMGNGSHDIRNVPMVTFGAAGGKIRTGRFVDVEDSPQKQAISNVFVSIGEAFGIDLRGFWLDSVGPAPGLV